MELEQAEAPREEGGKENATQWLSQGLETLIEQLQGRTDRSANIADFDVLIVGSGYGGAVAAAELALNRGDKSVCVLERGRERLPGAFPSRMADLAGHVRFATPGASRSRGRNEGLFDVRIGEDLCALVANGVGGGSLINAGVMTLPSRKVFESKAWPEALRDASSIDELLKTGANLRTRLGADKTVETVKAPLPRKFKALQALAGSRPAKALPITVALADEGVGKVRTPAGVEIDACVGCGDCVTGCNYNAKVSLDVTLLAEARQRGAEIYAGATVLRIEKIPREDAAPLWQVHVVHTDETLRRRQRKPFLLRASRLVLSAGTFGSTEILLRSQSDGLRFSPTLGHRVSSNGDLIAAAYDSRVDANCVGDEQRDSQGVAPENRVGPAITGMVDLRPKDERGAAPLDDGMVIQDLAVPGALRRLLEETVTTTAAVHLLAEADAQVHGGAERYPDPCAVDPLAVRRTLVVAIIGHDSADGVILLNPGGERDRGDGAVRVRWPTLRTYPPLLERHRKFEAMLRSTIGGRALPNPVWRLLPDKLDYIFGGQTGPLLTVHPLGGCPMGDDPARGVVDDLGRVFDADSSSDGRYHQGLVVLDGSIVPTSLGINPALSIASIALRAITALRDVWEYNEPAAPATAMGDRPYLRRPGPAKTRKPTQVEVVERLSGLVAVSGIGHGGNPLHVELTMRFDRVSLAALVAGTGAARLTLPVDGGKLRIFGSTPLDDREALDHEALLVAKVRGTLRLFHEEESSSLQRRLRGWWSWFRNRGLRDSVHWLSDQLAGEGPPPTGNASPLQEGLSRLKSSWDLSSRAGAVRLFEYHLEIAEIVSTSLEQAAVKGFQGGCIRGSKRLTYSRRGNPWRQLMEVSLDSFPFARGPKAILRLDTGFLARQGIPLMRIVAQEDQPTALADLTSLALYVLRMLIHVHVWSFRAPDIPKPRSIQRLPGLVPGLPPPVIHEFQVAEPRDGVPVMVRLTHYPAAPGNLRKAAERAGGGTDAGASMSLRTPILLIHGYSASGTTFAHHAVRPNLAEALWERGKDVWIADLRTSAGMPHARAPWRFEDAAMADIPVAIHQVRMLTGAERIDVFAHCMGAAMFGMALLGPKRPDEPFHDLRCGLHSRIRRLVTSQVAPAVLFTPANVFRAYAMRYLKYYLPISNYEFRPTSSATFVDQLIDRLLATLPYPEEEFDRENPFWTPWRRTPWVGTRHRMDALYGRDFSLNNLPQGVLDYIDDHFGPLNVDTVAQAIHFAHNRVITNHKGFNDYVTPVQLRENCTFPVFHVHGEENGLVSPRTPDHFQKVLEDCDVRFNGREGFDFEKYEAGHQDSLIGRPATQVFADVIRFLEKEDPPAPGRNSRDSHAAQTFRFTFASQVPAFGVRLGAADASAAGTYSFGDHGGRGEVVAVLLVPIIEHEGRYLPLSVGGPVEPTLESLKPLVRCAAVTDVWSSDEARRWRFNFNFNFNSDDDGRRPGHNDLLVMAMYDQSLEIGPPPRILFPAGLDDLAADLAERFVKPPAATGIGDGVGIIPIGIPADLIDRILDAIVESVRHVFEHEGNANISQGILRRPDPSESRHQAEAASSFALASCQYPGGMLDRTPPGVPDKADEGPADASYMRLLAVLRGERAGPVPTRLILTGDQIYADATAGLFDPKVLDDRFRLAYQAFLGARGPRLVLSRLPAVMRLDDHEIADNWEPDPGSNGCKGDEPSALGVQAYLRYQRDVDPQGSGPQDIWFEGEVNGFACFFADARTQRGPRDVDAYGAADILGAEQSKKVDLFLADTSKPGPRLFVSGSMVLPRRLEVRDGSRAAALRSDAWDGYPASLHRLLAGVYNRGIDDIVFLSGDEHISSVARIAVRRTGVDKIVVAHSIHSSALYAPYPFANGTENDFAGTEEFCFLHDGREYVCSVGTWYPAAGDGFAIVTIAKEPQGWSVAARFDREGCDPGDVRNIMRFRVPDQVAQPEPLQI